MNWHFCPLVITPNESPAIKWPISGIWNWRISVNKYCFKLPKLWLYIPAAKNPDNRELIIPNSVMSLVWHLHYCTKHYLYPTFLLIFFYETKLFFLHYACKINNLTMVKTLERLLCQHFFSFSSVKTVFFGKTSFFWGNTYFFGLPRSLEVIPWC